ncbi:MAG: hypothetical protein M3337_01555 [Actinomycetota bacterium]|nr:hypothetical protein [Actinomycetota bacterium]
MNHERSRLIMRLLTAFVIGFVTLTLEIAYTRVISFKLFYYYTYFVIGLALLGLGAASAVTSLSARLRSIDTYRLVQLVAPAAAIAGIVGYAVVARIPTQAGLIWEGSGGEATSQLLRLFVLSLSLTAVFFAVGLLLASLIVVEVRNVRRLYFWDLAGAALGCLAAVPLQATVGPPAMILGALTLLAVLGVVAASMGRGNVVATGGVVALVLVGAVVAGQLKVRTDDSKTVRDSDEIAAGGWGPVFRVDAVDLGDVYFLSHDGLLGSTIYQYDGTPATTERFAADARQIPFAAFDGDEPRVLIIGAAGGNEVQAALTYGVSHVDAVELNPVTVSLLRDDLAEFSGNITDNPKVNYVQGDGRTFLARSDEEYDIVWFVAPDSYAASNAATSGAFVLSESYLYTEEMIQTAYDHLSPGGVVVAQFGDVQLDAQSTRTARYLVTARQALADRVDSFADHSALITESGEGFLGRISTIMLFRPEVDAGTAERVQAVLPNVPLASAQYLPGAARADGVLSDLITGSPEEFDRIVEDYPYEISSIDDDQPFFWHFTSFGTVLTDWNLSDFDDPEIAVGERLLLVLLLLATVVAGLMLFVPFAVTRRRNRAETRLPRRFGFFVYFTALGLGFMLIEISMIQRFALLLGFPTLSLSVSLFTLLLATGVGAGLSGAVRRLGRWALPAVTAVLIVLAVIYIAVSDPLTEAALSWSQGMRIALVFALLFPIGLLLGVFLPTGMDAVVRATDTSGSDRDRSVAWCWAVNGFFSVLGSSLTTVISMEFGFNRALVSGLVLYVVATAVMQAGSMPTPPVTDDAVAGEHGAELESVAAR